MPAATSTSTRSARRTPARPVRRGPPPPAVVRVAALAALRAVLTGLLVTELLTVAAWASDPRSGSGSGAALRTGLVAWLVAHGATVAVAGGRFGLAPLSLTLLVAWFPLRAGASVVRAVEPRPL